MSQTQKVIKYFAIAFALFLAVSIFAGIFYGLSFISYVFDGNDFSEVKETEVLPFEGEVLSLDIKTAAVSLNIKTGDSFKVESNSEYINCENRNSTLTVEEENHNLVFGNIEKAFVTVYIPEDFIFDKTVITAGAGNVYIENISSDCLEFNCGAGTVKADNMNVFKKTEIKSGAGNFEVKKGKLNSLDFEMGIGSCDIRASVSGKSEIECGMGNIKLRLMGNKEDYKIKAEKGLGDIKIDGKNVSGDTTFGDGENKIDISGGIGSIYIDFENK